MRKLIFGILFILTTTLLYSAIGYVDNAKRFNGSWRAPTLVGGEIYSVTFPVPILLDTIVVTGDEVGGVVVLIGTQEIRRYGYAANRTAGEIFVMPIYIASGVAISFQLESGADGFHGVSISGTLQ